eukprot:sb/3478733/
MTREFYSADKEIKSVTLDVVIIKRERERETAEGRELEKFVWISACDRIQISDTMITSDDEEPHFSTLSTNYRIGVTHGWGLISDYLGVIFYFNRYPNC